MGTKDNPGSFDCYANAAPDEPMFVLLGRDKHAPTLVWLWATLREIDQEDPAKVDEARQCAVAMMEYARAHGRPVAGLGQAFLAGAAEMIRTTNGSIKALRELQGTGDVINTPTDIDVIRRYLCETEFEPEPEKTPAP